MFNEQIPIKNIKSILSNPKWMKDNNGKTIFFSNQSRIYMPETKLLYETENLGHRWKRNKNGTIDEYAYQTDNHSGPMCEDCYYCFCDMCQELPTERCEFNDNKNQIMNNLFTELGI